MKRKFLIAGVLLYTLVAPARAVTCSQVLKATFDDFDDTNAIHFYVSENYGGLFEAMRRAEQIGRDGFWEILPAPEGKRIFHPPAQLVRVTVILMCQ